MLLTAYVVVVVVVVVVYRVVLGTGYKHICVTRKWLSERERGLCAAHDSNSKYRNEHKFD